MADLADFAKLNKSAILISELPVVAAVEDNRDLQTRVDEEFKKSGKWRTFTGEDIARKNLINEVIKLEQANLKDEPMDEEEMSEFLKSQKKKDKKPKKQKPKNNPTDCQYCF